MALKEQDGEQQYAVICANDGSVERERERERERCHYRHLHCHGSHQHKWRQCEQMQFRIMDFFVGKPPEA